VNIALLVARLLLTLVFVVAGVAKLVDRNGSRQAIRYLGLPAYVRAYRSLTTSG
jgi:uncharacterized membrane protein YphA (DoxX/SURF4 family)